MSVLMTCLALAVPCSHREGTRHPITPEPRGGHAELLREPVGDLRNWICIHRREGAWNDDTGNGYYGGLQFNDSFERSYGSDMRRKYGGHANLWTPRDQIIVAERARASGRGYYPWPQTARMCGLI